MTFASSQGRPHPPTITPSLAGRLLKGKPVPLRALVSAKEGRKFDAKGELHNDPQYGWSVRLIFEDFK